jgi:hypothetical protein
MKWRPALLLVCLHGQAAFAGPSAKTFVGVVHDNRCVGPACATKCPINKSPVYTLQSGEDAYILSAPKPPEQFVGRRVVVTGTVDGNKLRVRSIAPAR